MHLACKATKTTFNRCVCGYFTFRVWKDHISQAEYCVVTKAVQC